MNSRNNFIDADSSILESSLRFVKNELEDELNTMLDNSSKEPDLSKLPYKIINPDPGFCIKTYKLIDDEKLFINICQSDGIPPPENVTTEQLRAILNTDSNTFKVPMSITEIRRTKDKSNNLAYVCDIAINPKFFLKIDRLLLFRDFFFTIIVEAMETKFNLKIDQSKFIILKNRKFVGTLVSHKVQNRDVRKVLETYQNPEEDEKKLLAELSEEQSKKLIEEIPSVQNMKTMPEPRLVILPTNDIITEFLLPGIVNDKEIDLDVGEDCIVLSCPKRGYAFNGYFDYKIDQSKSIASFNERSSILTVTMPIAV